MTTTTTTTPREAIRTPCSLCDDGVTYLHPGTCFRRHGEPHPCAACAEEMTTRAEVYGADYDRNLAGEG
jgi:hypothetical protein